MSKIIPQQIIDQRKERWIKFLSPEAPPGFMFIVKISNPAENVDPERNIYLLSFGSIQERIEQNLISYEKMLKRGSWLHDDIVPYAKVHTATEIFAEAFGCQVHRDGVSVPFAMPLINEAKEVAKLPVPDPMDTPLVKLFEIADGTIERTGKNTVLGLPDIQSPMDIAALIWRKEDLMISLITEPGAVKELTQKIYQLMTAFLDKWFQRYGTEYIAHFPEYFMSGGITLSEDEAGIVNPEMFNEFFKPMLVKLSEHYGGLGIHCCADARQQWENFKNIPGLRLLNLCNKNPDYIHEAYEYFSKATVSMHSGWLPEGEIKTWPEQFPSESRYVLQVSATNREDAMKKAEKLNQTRECNNDKILCVAS